MSRVFDCFLYCDEADALEIRLHELDPVVDQFVLCEATRTFDGQVKPPHFRAQKERFASFLPKITHVLVDDFPPNLSARDFKHFQRNAQARGLADCAPDDIVIVSDVDEIPHPDAIRTFEGPISGLRMRLFFRYLNLEDVNAAESNTVRSVICRHEYLRSPQHVRALGKSNNVLNKIVDNGGWHFSHLGDTDALGGNENPACDFVPIDASYPDWVVSNRDRYAALIAQAPLRTQTRDDAFASIYCGQARPEVLAMVPREARRVLELGCASGILAATLKQRQECQVTGVEYLAEPAAEAATRLDRVIVGDCETLDLDALFQKGEFDCLIAADVLEHLREPESLLRRLQPFMTPDASIVVSMPNVRHAGVLEAAVEGYWSYQKWGVLDRTHLRFFTRREIDNMFARLGFEVEERRTVDDAAVGDWERLGRPISPTFGALTVNGLDEQEIREFFVVQWLVRARSALRPRGALPTTTPDDRGTIEVDALGLDRLVPRVSAGADLLEEVTSRLHQEHDHAQALQAELSRRDEELADTIRHANELQAGLTRRNEELANNRREADGLHRELTRRDEELTRRDEELADEVREADGWHRQFLDRDADYRSLAAAYASLAGEKDVALRNLQATLSSTSWRMSAPLRVVTGGLPAPEVFVRDLLRGRPRTQAALRRARRLVQMPHQVADRLRAPFDGTSATLVPAADPAIETTPAVYSARPIGIDSGPDRFAQAGRRRLICMTHVLPYPSRAGNEYRIHHMLTWLAAKGWDVLLLVYPLPDEPMTSVQVAQAAAATAAQYPNIIICEPDGTLLYRLRDGGAMLQGLLGRHPRNFAPLLGEGNDGTPVAANVPSIMRTICPDVLIELLLHLDAELQPEVLLAEYVFMTRPFALLRPGVLKVIDTIDLFSTKQTKVGEYGIDDGFGLTPQMESGLLNRADVLIAIQAAEAEGLRKLAPQRKVISVGVDFKLIEQVPPSATRPVVLLVGSGNPLNVKGLNDFLRFAWPLVRKSVPEPELHVVGSVGAGVDPFLPGVRVLGRVENLRAEYAEARVVINPTIAGTGLKIKTVEALCHLRPIVVWPSGVDGLEPQLRELCRVATDWFDFARHVIELASVVDGAQALVDRRLELATRFAPDTVYEPLGAALGSL